MQCAKCQRSFNRLTQHLFDVPSGWCKGCLNAWQRDMQMRADKFQASFRHHLFRSGAQVTQELMAYFNDYAQKLGLTPQQAFQSVHAEALHLLSRALVDAKADGVITPQEEAYILWLEKALHLHPTQTMPIRNELRHIKTLQAIRSGSLPVVQASIMLPSEETCHWESASHYHKVLSTQTKVMPGSLIITNQKIRFLSLQSGFEFPLSKVGSVRYQAPEGIYLHLTRSQGNGYYGMAQADVLCEMLHVLLRRFHRQEVIQQSDTRTVPQNIKVAVWQRDGGKCVQCGANSYLEYDHIIPYSKGGATSTNNVQLLCRRCNLSKGDRI